MTWLLMLTTLASAGFTETVWETQPQVTRTGHPRFVAPDLHDSGAYDAVLDRLTSGGESVEVRMALVEWLPRIGGDWAPALTEAFADEADARVRRVMADTAAKAKHDGRPLVTLAARDAHADVRAAALRAAIGTESETVILGALTDADAGVRAAAAFSAGALALPQASDGLERGLSDEDAEVRLASLRALRTIDPARAKAAAPALAADDDRRVQRLANSLR